MATYTYQVQRSADGSTGWSDVAGANGTFDPGAPPFSHDVDYTTVSGDSGDYLRMKVTDSSGVVQYSPVVGPIGPTPTPPPPSGGAYAWDAKTATVDPDSASLIAAWLSYAFVHTSEFACNFSLGIADGSSPGYSVPHSQAGCIMDPTIYIPLGTQPGVSSDHHLSVLDPVHNREHHMWEATYDPVTRRITGCKAGNSGVLGEFIQGKCSSNASGIPQTRCGVMPDEVEAGVIPHALMCSMPNTGPGPARYPSNATVGWPSNTGLNAGTWLSLDPSIDVASLGLGTFERILAKCLQDYGMFVSDQDQWSLNIKGMYPGGGRAGYDAWQAVGVTLTAGGTSTNPPWALLLSSTFHTKVWEHMRVLSPPAH